LKIAQSEAKLYGGKLHNPKELQDIEKEIVSLKKHLDVLVDQQLEAMMAVEDCETADASARETLIGARASFMEKSAGLLGKKDSHLHILERLNSERSAALSLVDPTALQTYNNLRRRKSGVAVTTITDGSCSVCGGEIRPSELQSARVSQTLVYCSSCGRIFYTG
jgi:predicted  nucleic acid-binding Zn-ribbon protein